MRVYGAGPGIASAAQQRLSLFGLTFEGRMLHRTQGRWAPGKGEILMLCHRGQPLQCYVCCAG